MSNCEKIIELEKRIKELEDQLSHLYPYAVPYYPQPYIIPYRWTCTGTDTVGTVVYGDEK